MHLLGRASGETVFSLWCLVPSPWSLSTPWQERQTPNACSLLQGRFPRELGVGVGAQGEEGYIYLEKDSDSIVHQESTGLQKL